MASIFRRRRGTQPIPDGAKITTRKRRGGGAETIATWTGLDGRKHSAPLNRAGDRIVSLSRDWTIEFTNEHGMPQRVASGTPDRLIAEQIASRLESDAAMRKRGLLDPEAEQIAEQAKRPLADHVADFEHYLQSKGVTPRHASETISRINAVLGAGSCSKLADLSTSRIQAALVARYNNRSPRSFNAGLTAVRSFARWAYRERRTASEPLMGLVRRNEAIDRKLVRRELSGDEAAWLLRSTATRPVSHGLDGSGRSVLYALMLGSGLRIGECRSLTRQSFSLDSKTPTVTVEARSSKRRKRDCQPIHVRLAAVIKGWLERIPDDGQPLFPVDRFRTGAMFKADCQAARNAWLAAAANQADRLEREGSDFLCVVDSQGRTLDCHSLRHSYVSGLVRAGASVPTAQRLARHADPSLTIGRYSHANQEEVNAALPAPPTLDPVNSLDRKWTGRGGEMGLLQAACVIDGSQGVGDATDRNMLEMLDLANCGKNSQGAPSWDRTKDLLIKSQLPHTANPGDSELLDKEWTGNECWFTAEAIQVVVARSNLPQYVRAAMLSLVRLTPKESTLGLQPQGDTRRTGF